MTKQSAEQYNIRIGKRTDIKLIRELSKLIPEFKDTDFNEMTDDDLLFCITNPKGLFLLAEDLEKNLIGLIYGYIEVPSRACVMYLGVDMRYRKRGIASTLWHYYRKEISVFYDVKKIYVLTTNFIAGKFFEAQDFGNKSLLSYYDRSSVKK